MTAPAPDSRPVADRIADLASSEPSTGLHGRPISGQQWDDIETVNVEGEWL